jgi:hypothetical protein
LTLRIVHDLLTGIEWNPDFGSEPAERVAISARDDERSGIEGTIRAGFLGAATWL